MLRDLASSPPYVRFQTLKDFLVRLARRGIPRRIGRSMMSRYPATTRLQIPAALRFLGLCDRSGVPTRRLRPLVSATRSEPSWQATLGRVVTTSYARLMRGIDVAKASPREIARRFEQQTPVRGSTLRKAMRFYLVALREAGVQTSPNLVTRSQVHNRRRARAGTTRVDGDHAQQLTQQIVVAGRVRGVLRLPTPYGKEDLAAARAAIDFLARALRV
jgi:hypothetical protein